MSSISFLPQFICAFCFKYRSDNILNIEKMPAGRLPEKGWPLALEVLKWRWRRGSLRGFNAYDIRRVREVGPDRAAAEWIVRCDGKVRFDRCSEVFDNYNVLQSYTAELDPRKPEDQLRLVSIDADDSCISIQGCMHFDGLQHLQELRLRRCFLFTDNALIFICRTPSMAQCLRQLQIESCPNMDEDALKHIGKLRALRSLVIFDLPLLNREKAVYLLRHSLGPECEITIES